MFISGPDGPEMAGLVEVRSVLCRGCSHLRALFDASIPVTVARMMGVCWGDLSYVRASGLNPHVRVQVIGVSA